MSPCRTSTLPVRALRGYTLVELVITVAILAILATIAVPSFARVIASNSIAGGVNEFIAAVNLARTEAIRRGGNAGICASEDGASCGSDWDEGYLVYFMDAGELTPLRTGSLSSRNTLTGSLDNIVFNGRGLGSSSGTLSYKPTDETYEELERCLNVSVTGAISSGACTP